MVGCGPGCCGSVISQSVLHCSISMILGGFVVMALVVGSRMMSSLGWSLSLGCKPAAVLRFLW
jgi:hypothetical protein